VALFAFVGSESAQAQKEETMNTAFQRIGAGLAALFLMVAPALASTPTDISPHSLAWIGIALCGAGILGTVTVTYKWPVSSTVAPTGAQAAKTMVVVAEVNWADADTTTLVTHNFGLGTVVTNAFPTTGQYMPEVLVTETSKGTAGIVSQTIAWTNSVAITIGKSSTAGSGGTFVVYMRLPHSVGM
jgi:hypothetical protein